MLCVSIILTVSWQIFALEISQLTFHNLHVLLKSYLSFQRLYKTYMCVCVYDAPHCLFPTNAIIYAPINNDDVIFYSKLIATLCSLF